MYKLYLILWRERVVLVSFFYHGERQGLAFMNLRIKHMDPPLTLISCFVLPMAFPQELEQHVKPVVVQ